VTRTWGLDRTTEGVRVWGEIDLAAGDLTDQLIAAASPRAIGTEFVIDLSGVTFMDSTGLNALLQVSKTCPRIDIAVRTSAQVFSVFKVAGLVETPWPNVVILPPDEDDPPA
jgi:anti-anti-sigma factor